MTLKWLVASFAAGLLLASCAPTHNLDIPTHEVPTFELVDKRPQGDKDTSYGRLDGKWAISKFGDGSFTPDRLVLLKSLLDDAYGQELKGKRIEVTRLRTLVYLYPRNNLGEMINEAHGLQIYPGIPDPRKDWWIFEIAASIDGKTYARNIAKETPETKFCASCYQDVRSKVVLEALNEFVDGFGKNAGLKK
jgi:hypothetical protein